MIDYIPSGDSAFLVKFGDEISEEINRDLRTYFIAFNEKKIKGVIECIPSYSDLMVLYDPLIIQYKALLHQLKQIAENIKDISIPEARTIEIPVLYGQPFGEDIQAVQSHTKMSEQEIIKAHSENKYLVYMLGFTQFLLSGWYESPNSNASQRGSKSEDFSRISWYCIPTNRYLSH